MPPLCSFKITLNYKLIRTNQDDISCLLGNRCKLRQFDSWNIDKIDEELETDSKHSGLKISASGVFKTKLSTRS